MEKPAFLEKNKKIVDKFLLGYVKKQKEMPYTLKRAISYSLFGNNKRIRPSLCLEIARICGLEYTKVLPIASALELIHNYSLVHDDLPSMDDDDYRRGKLTCHKKFTEATAILAGDAMIFMAFDLAQKYYSGNELKSIISHLTKASGPNKMIAGQILDITRNKRNYEEIVKKKTAALIEASVNIACDISKAPKNIKKSLKVFGQNFGFLFQVLDDAKDKDGFVKIIGEEKTFLLAEEIFRKISLGLEPIKETKGLLEAAKYLFLQTVS